MSSSDDTSHGPDIDPSVLQTAIEAMCGDHEHYPAHINRLEFDWQPKSHLLDGKFLYPLFGAGGPDIDALIEYIYQSLVPYCLPRAEVKRVTDKAFAEKDMHALIALGDKARELFVRTRSAAITGGEAGELLLFLTLEAMVKAPLLVSKMSLKTNSNMNIHGRDGVHVRYCPKLKSLVLHLGESKLHKGLAGAIDDAIGSITEYLNDLALRKREIAIIHGHMDLHGIDPAADRHLRDLLNPYRVPRPLKHEIHTCFIGFEYPAYGKVAALPPEEVEEAFRQQYAKRALEITGQIQEKVGVNLPAPKEPAILRHAVPGHQALPEDVCSKTGDGT